MRGNYEFCVREARGEYITILGDDDGFTYNGLEYARSVLRQSSPEVMFWWPHMYWWPNALLKHKQWMLYVLKARRSFESVDAFLPVKRFFGEGANHGLFERLPSIYNGFVSRTLLERIKEATGAYFLDEIPDVYGGVANGFFARSAVFIGWPLTIRGISGKSFGVAFRDPGGQALAEDFKRHMRSPMCEPDLVESTALAVHIASVNLRAIRNPQGRLKDFRISIPEVIGGILGEIGENPLRREALLADARTLAAKYGLEINVPPGEFSPDAAQERRWGWESPEALAINCEPIGVRDILGARSLVLATLGA